MVDMLHVMWISNRGYDWFGLKEIIGMCNNRVVLFDNKTPRGREVETAGQGIVFYGDTDQHG